MESEAGRPFGVAVNGWQFTGVEWGDAGAPAVLLLHGFPQTSDSWRAVGVRLADAGLRAVALDQRGYSPGARPTEEAAYALPELVADVTAMIAALGAPVDLVGHDWGGVVGWQVAARFPGLLRSWTAVSTPHPLAIAAALAGPNGAEQRTAFEYIVAFRRPGFAERLLAQGAAGLRGAYGSVVAPERVEHDVAVLSQPGVLELALNWYRAMSPTDAAGLAEVAVPTTYVWGSEDVAFRRPAAELTANHVAADYLFVPLEGASHWLPDEAADTLADLIARRVLDR